MTLKNLPFDFDIFLPKAIRFFSESTVKKSFINVHLLPEVNVVRHARRFKLEFQFINPNMKVFRYTLGKLFFLTVKLKKLEKNIGAGDMIQYLLFSNSKKIANSILLKNNETLYREILLNDYEIFFVDNGHILRPSYKNSEYLIDIADNKMAELGERVDRPLEHHILKKNLVDSNRAMREIFPVKV
jgi:hypothetical protein